VDVVDLVRALMHDMASQGVEEVVHIKDTELISGLNERSHTSSLAGLTIADDEKLDEFIRLVLA
jgi:hypothetical protein